MTKICTTCKTEKDILLFNKDASRKSGVSPQCKECKNAKALETSRTIDGLCKKIYKGQKRRSKDRGHDAPSYTLEELTSWIKAQAQFTELYQNWADSDYSKNLVPSVDRSNPNIGYTMNNITLMTWEENNKKGAHDIKKGIDVTCKSKAVVQLTMEGDFVAEYFSATEAKRQTGFNQGSISASCCGKRKQTGGFIWIYKDDYKEGNYSIVERNDRIWANQFGVYK